VTHVFLRRCAGKIDAYMEAADFFADRKDADYLQHALDGAARLGVRDSRLDFYRAVLLLLRRVDLSSAEALSPGLALNAVSLVSMSSLHHAS